MLPVASSLYYSLVIVCLCTPVYGVCNSRFRWPSPHNSSDINWATATYVTPVTYNSSGIVIGPDAVEFHFSVVTVSPSEYLAGMMSPLLDNLTDSSLGIDTNGGILELNISVISGNASSVDTAPFTIRKQSDSAGTSYTLSSYNAMYFRFYNDGYLSVVSNINGSAATIGTRWIANAPVYSQFYVTRFVFSATNVSIYNDGAFVAMFSLFPASLPGSWQFLIDASKRNAGSAAEGPGVWQLANHYLAHYLRMKLKQTSSTLLVLKVSPLPQLISALCLACTVGDPLLVNLNVSAPIEENGKCKLTASAKPSEDRRSFDVLISVRRTCSSKRRILIFVLIAISLLILAVVVAVVLLVLGRKGYLARIWSANPKFYRPKQYRNQYLGTKQGGGGAGGDLSAPLVESGN